MALRKKGLKVAVTTMALVSVITSMGLSNVYADNSISNNTISIERAIENNSYTIKNKIEYLKDGEVITSGHGYQSLRDALSEDTLVEVINNKIFMTLEFTDSQYSLIDNIVVSVDEQDYSFEKSDSRKYRIELNSLDSDIKLSYNVNVPVPNMPPHNFTVNVVLSDAPELEEKNEAPVITAKDLSIYVGDKFEAKLEVTANDKEDGDLTSSIKVTSNNVDTSKAGKYSVTYEVTDLEGLTTTKTITVTVLQKDATNPNKLSDGKYKIKNTTKYSGTSSMGESMVRNSLKDVSYLEVKDGNVYVTLEFDSELYKVMQNIKVYVDGKSVKLTEDNTNGKVTFKVDSIESNIEVSTYITAMGMNINYSVGLEESTIETVSSSSNENTGTGTEGNTGGSTNGGNSSNSSSNSTTSSESTVKKGKLYTIQNSVYHESQTGKDMARKYLNSTSKVEEVDGQKYVTLTFTGSDYMKNHVIYVNGSKVSHSIAYKSGDTISLRFKVSSLNDTIKVRTYIVPMSRDIEFGVKLLEDTLTFVKDYEISSEDSTLPQTGSIISNTTGMGVGSSLVVAGSLLKRRKRK